MKYYDSELVTGVANSEVFGGGITSTENEIKVLKAVVIAVSARQANTINIWHEREKIVSLLDSNLPLATDAYRRRIELDHEIPIGNTIKGSVLSGATGNNPTIEYEYEIKS